MYQTIKQLLNPVRVSYYLVACLCLQAAVSFGQDETNPTDVGSNAIPAEIMPTLPLNNILQNQIESILGMTESKIMQGITDPGLDISSLVINKALDELIKTIADDVVLSVAAEKIMTAYQKVKDKKLVSKLSDLRSVWKDGQERLNKLNLQDFKIRLQFATQYNQENNPVAQSSIKSIANTLSKNLYGTEVAAINQTYDNGGATSKLVKKYLSKGGEDMAYYNLSILMGTLGSTDLIKARDKLESSSGKTVFLSPYERLKLQLESLQEAQQRHAYLTTYGQKIAASVNKYRLAESEQAIRQQLSKKAFDPYMAQYQK